MRRCVAAPLGGSFRLLPFLLLSFPLSVNRFLSEKQFPARIVFAAINFFVQRSAGNVAPGGRTKSFSALLLFRLSAPVAIRGLCRLRHRPRQLKFSESMHELSIALSILDWVALEAIRRQAREVKEIELEVGRLAGVDISTLAFSMQAVQRYSPFEKARVKIVEVEPLAECRACGRQFLPHCLFDCCPHCHSFGTELLRGRELRLKSICVE